MPRVGGACRVREGLRAGLRAGRVPLLQADRPYLGSLRQADKPGPGPGMLAARARACACIRLLVRTWAGLSLDGTGGGGCRVGVAPT